MDNNAKRDVVGKAWRACIAVGVDPVQRKGIVDHFAQLIGIEPPSVVDGFSAAEVAWIEARTGVRVTVTVPGQAEPIAQWERDGAGKLVEPKVYSELPDAIRVPLHRIWADAGYLVGRAIDNPTNGRALAVHTIKALCDELERSIRATYVPRLTRAQAERLAAGLDDRDGGHDGMVAFVWSLAGMAPPLASSDPEGHRQAMADADADASSIDQREVIEERDRLKALINSPEVENFLRGTHIEAVHQVERWGEASDRAKRPADWFWLVGYLGGKALHAAASHKALAEEGCRADDQQLLHHREKALHHCISTAAALYNWHCAIKGVDVRMSPGRSDLAEVIDSAFPGEAP